MRKAILIALAFVGLIAAARFLPPKSWFYEVLIYQRAPLLWAYLKRTAMATRHHLGVDPAAPLAEFERIAPAHPVFHIVSPISQREE